MPDIEKYLTVGLSVVVLVLCVLLWGSRQENKLLKVKLDSSQKAVALSVGELRKFAVLTDEQKTQIENLKTIAKQKDAELIAEREKIRPQVEREQKGATAIRAVKLTAVPSKKCDDYEKLIDSSIQSDLEGSD